LHFLPDSAPSADAGLAAFRGDRAILDPNPGGTTLAGPDDEDV
jgi:hypothetical protein